MQKLSKNVCSDEYDECAATFSTSNSRSFGRQNIVRLV